MSLLTPQLRARLANITGQEPLAATPLSGGCIAQVAKVELADDTVVVVKLAPEGGLALEGRMLRDLAKVDKVPVPEVLAASDNLLVLAFIPSDGRLDASAERHAAELLAGLHGVGAEAFGYPYDTLIGALPQPNPWSESWIDFFRDQRLLTMGRRALEAGRLPAASFGRLETLCGRLETWIDEPNRPALIHGDLWDGNILAAGGRIAALLDPAIYYADPEIELAFTTLFGTFGEAFFERYGELRPIAPGFFETRRELYNLYPLLVHVTLFGGGYVQSVERTLDRFLG
ncbi:MAG: fructosamine kinase family protein [Pseudomonadota bacterium]